MTRRTLCLRPTMKTAVAELRTSLAPPSRLPLSAWVERNVVLPDGLWWHPKQVIHGAKAIQLGAYGQYEQRNHGP
jgi:hypothetical protein